MSTKRSKHSFRSVRLLVHRPVCVCVRVRGFTLIEVIVVIVMLGTLAVIAAPRMFSSTDFYARGFHDETLALLRYAQKTAIAQRRMVCVAFSAPAPATAILSIASATGADVCKTPLSGPNKSCDGGPTGCITARADVSYSTSPLSLSFNGLGQPSAPSSTTIQVASSGVAIASAVTVEAEIGYVHD